MHNYKNKKLDNNDLFFKKYETITRSKTTIEQQDNESLNTMDYYKEENSSKQNIFDENIYTSKKKIKQSTDIKSKQKIENPKFLANFNNTYISHNLGGLYDEISFARNTTLFLNKNQKEKNVEKRFETIATDYDYCSRCNSEINYSTKVCSNCSKPFCKKCIKEIVSRNLDNNMDSNNFSKNINAKNCPNCGKSAALKNFVAPTSKKKSSPLITREPFDNEPDKTSSSSHNQNDEKDLMVKGLKEQSNEYDLLLKKIEEKKKEIEIKKDLNLNIIQILQKSVEYEYNFNLNKLNQMRLKIQKIQDMITDKMNKLNHQRNFNSNEEFQNITEKFKNALSVFSKNYEKLEQKNILKLKPKAYKCYESKPLLLNLSDTYCMKSKEILSNDHIGNAFIRVDRYVNGFVNCLGFSVSIKNDKNNALKNNSNMANKPKYVVNLIVDNKIIKLTKVNKDKNSSCLVYECSLEENQVFNTKSQSNGVNNFIKKDDFCIKLIVTELIL